MKNILLIEDNPDDAELTLRSLKKANISNAITYLTDGAKALEYLATQALPGLVLLDLNLPKIAGLDVLKQMRHNARTHELPVIIFTSSTDQRDMIDAYSLGVNGYIEKPIVFSELAQAVRRVGLTWVISDMHDACTQLKAELTDNFSNELERANRLMKDWQENAYWAQDEMKRLRAENEKLRTALAYYAHPEHYAPRLTMTGERPAGVLVDSGEIARSALKEGEK